MPDKVFADKAIHPSCADRPAGISQAAGFSRAPGISQPATAAEMQKDSRTMTCSTTNSSQLGAIFLNNLDRIDILWDIIDILLTMNFRYAIEQRHHSPRIFVYGVQ